MTTDELFAKFGGRDAIVALTGAARNAVNNWRREGIPYKHFGKLIRFAEQKGIAGVTHESLEISRTKARQASKCPST